MLKANNNARTKPFVLCLVHFYLPETQILFSVSFGQYSISDCFLYKNSFVYVTLNLFCFLKVQSNGLCGCRARQAGAGFHS